MQNSPIYYTIIVMRKFKIMTDAVLIFIIITFLQVFPVYQVPAESDGGNMNSMYLSIPKQIREWQAVAADEIYTRETIYKYLDGGAELYLAYDFKEVFARKYSGPGDNELTLDIYDMGSAADAFGVFTSEREEDEAGIGQNSEYGDGLLRFWKNRYFVSILATGNDPSIETIVKEIGGLAAAAITSSGTIPDMIDCLPEQGLDKKRVRFFHTDLLLNKHYYVSDENILDLSSKTDCVLARYPIENQEPTYLLLVRYLTAGQAEKAYAKFLQAYMPDAQGSGCVKTENQRWTMAVRNREIITIVFDAATREKTAELSAAVKSYKKEK